MATKQEVLRAHLKDWLATKQYGKERRKLRDQLAQTIQIHRNSVGRAMRRLQRTPRVRTETRGRPRVYIKEVDTALYELWDAMEKPCAEILRPAIDTYIKSFVRNERWQYGTHTEALVKGMSIGSIKTRIAGWRQKEGIKRGYSTTRTSPLKEIIPIRKSHTWKNLPPGYLQMDTVVHCGDLLTIDVAYSVGGVDFATYWSEYTVQWNKGKEATGTSIDLLCTRFPFSIHEIHPDTGDEFINYHVHAWATDHDIAMTRSEPYKKNDNMCIEERNNTMARRYLGYARIDELSLIPLAARILEKACLIHNNFRPVRRMTDKVRIGAKWHRTFEKVAKTPYERVQRDERLSPVLREQLRMVHDTLDPLSLHTELGMLKEELFKKLAQKNARKV